MAALAIEDGKVSLRAQILSEDGREQVRDEAMFESATETPEAPGAAMLDKAPDVDPAPVPRMRRLFIFRPEPGARQTSSGAGARPRRGVDALVRLDPLDWDAPDPARFRCAAADQRQCGAPRRERLDRSRALAGPCRRRGTAEAARERLRHCDRGNGGVDACSPSSLPIARLLHLCGEDRASLAGGQRSPSVPVYRAIAKADVPASTALEGLVAVVHSPRAARGSPSSSPPDDRSTIRIAAISEAAAEAAGQAGRVRGRRRAQRYGACWPSPRGCATHEPSECYPINRTGWAGARLLIGLLAARRRRGRDLGPCPLGAAARFLGVAPETGSRAAPSRSCSAERSIRTRRQPARSRPQEIDAARGAPGPGRDAAQRAAGSAGRADALLVAFAARRAIDRGVALGYLETLLVERFGPTHQRAVATIVTASRDSGAARRADRRI